MSNGQSTLYGPGSVKTAFGVAIASGDNLIVTAVPKKRIRVLAFQLGTPLTLTSTFQDDDGNIMGTFSFTAGTNDTITAPYLEVGWCETKVGGRLDLNNAAALPVFYTIKYEVP